MLPAIVLKQNLVDTTCAPRIRIVDVKSPIMRQFVRERSIETRLDSISSISVTLKYLKTF